MSAMFAEPVVEISHRERLLLAEAADGMPRRSPSATRPNFGRSPIRGRSQNLPLFHLPGAALTTTDFWDLPAIRWYRFA